MMPSGYIFKNVTKTGAKTFPRSQKGRNLIK